jgi:CelD/BcsL family acetyltransferase involved in cellulose biosynthesis
MADEGVACIDWGAGDPGYKSEMGAVAGPAIVDHLFVRNRLLARLVRPFWRS